MAPESPNGNWGNLIARIRSSRPAGYGGPVMVSVNVLISAEGVPLTWSKPQATLFEPQRCEQQLIADLTERKAGL